MKPVKKKLSKAMVRVLERMERGACIIETEWWVFMSDKVHPFVPFQITEAPGSNMAVFYEAATDGYLLENPLTFKGAVLRIYSISAAGRKALKEKG